MIIEFTPEELNELNYKLIDAVTELEDGAYAGDEIIDTVRLGCKIGLAIARINQVQDAFSEKTILIQEAKDEH